VTPPDGPDSYRFPKSLACTGPAPEEMRTVQQIRNRRPVARRERPWRETLPSDPRDPDVVRAKALTCKLPPEEAP